MKDYTDTMARYEAMRENRGEDPHEIDEERFFYLLEVLPPANWSRGDFFECFRVIECQTADLYTWAARMGKGEAARFWEMVAPRNSTPAELMAKVITAERVEGEK
jgi:hypothetical protein